MLCKLTVFVVYILVKAQAFVDEIPLHRLADLQCLHHHILS